MPVKNGGKRMLAYALCLGAALTLPACAGQQAKPSRGLCYRITGGRNEMVILGSIHVGNQDMSRLGAHITDAMNEADIFVLECDNQSDQARAEVREMTQAGTPLRELVSPACWARLEEVCQQGGGDLEAFDGMRPWAVASALSTQAAAVELGAKNAAKALSMGVESMVKSRGAGKAYAYLETAAEQLAVLDSFSPALQEAMLDSACQLILEPVTTSLADWPLWWRDGEEAKFAAAYQRENDLNDPALTQEYHDGLVAERNQKMARRLQALLEGEAPHAYFVTIGLLHLVLPEDSVLYELEQMGYGVERMEP